MRIAHITTDFRPQVGGAEVYIQNLIEALAPLGAEQVVVQLDNSERDPSLIGDDSVLLLPRAPGKWQWQRGPNLYWFNRQLKKHHVKRFLKSCDAVIVNYPFHWPPVAWHPRAIAISHCVEWRQPPEKWTHRRRKKIARKCHRRAAGLVANDTNFWREMGLTIEPKTHEGEQVAPNRWYIPNAVDTERFVPVPGAQPPPRIHPLMMHMGGEKHWPYILVARNASRHRGIHLAVEAVGMIAREHPEVALIIAGEPAEGEYREEIDLIAKTQGIADRVHHIGHVPFDEMPALCQGAALSLVPTLHHEGTSLAALETMACGVATISTTHGGLADLPTAHTPKPTSKALAKAISQVWPQREEIGAKQRAIVEERFNRALWAERWRGVVSTVLG